MREEILHKLIDRTAKALNVDASTLNENTIVADLGLKSLEMAGIIASFEDDYDAYIKYTDFMHAKTIGEAADILVKAVG